MKNKGFTLVEILVVVVLLGLSAAWYTNSYFQQREKQNLLTALASTRSYLDSIRQGSVSLLVPSDVSIEDFGGYGFTVNQSLNKLTKVYLNTTTSVNLTDYKFNQFQNIQLYFPDSGTVFFAKGSGYLQTSLGALTTITLVLQNTVTNECASLAINNQGIITTNENVSCL